MHKFTYIGKLTRPLRVLAAATLLAALACAPSLAQVIRVTGQVVSRDKNAPLFAVVVVDAKTNRALTQTDEDGRFAVNVHSGGTLKFTMVGAKAQTIKVRGTDFLNVKLDDNDIQLGEATVQAKKIKDKVMPEPTQIEIKGNYLHIRTRVRVPREMFAHDTRLVLQPILNNVTRKELMLMKPLIYDAKEYNLTQDRMYDFSMKSLDPLAKDTIVVKSDKLKEKGRNGDIIGYTDSIYVKNNRDNFLCDVYMAIENYNKILYRDTTVIARGTVNPLRLLDYKFAGSQITDSTFYPKAEMQLRDSKGDIDLRFAIGSSDLDMSNPKNASELKSLSDQLKAIGSSKDASLRSFRIMGTASPDGRFRYNLRLAQNRMNKAMNHVLAQIDPSLRKGMDVRTSAKVAPWSEVVKAMRADSLDAEADKIEQITTRWGDIDIQSSRIRRLPFYRSLLEGKYLPRLRRVEYQMEYSIFRFLTIDEIKELYEKDYKQLSRYEFFRLYRAEADTARRAKYIHQALEQYPSFMVAASDLEAMLIERGQSDPDLLQRFAGKKAPTQLNVNYIIACINNGRSSQADSVAEFVPTTEETKLLKAVASAMSGNYADNFETIASTGLRNEVVMLLAMKKNKEAWEKSEGLPEKEATTHYLKAICLNRLEKPVDAYTELLKAFKIDPKLKDMAKIDGDVNGLLPENKN